MFAFCSSGTLIRKHGHRPALPRSKFPQVWAEDMERRGTAAPAGRWTHALAPLQASFTPGPHGRPLPESDTSYVVIPLTTSSVYAAHDVRLDFGPFSCKCPTPVSSPDKPIVGRSSWRLKELLFVNSSSSFGLGEVLYKVLYAGNGFLYSNHNNN